MYIKLLWFLCITILPGVILCIPTILPHAISSSLGHLASNAINKHANTIAHSAVLSHTANIISSHAAKAIVVHASHTPAQHIQNPTTIHSDNIIRSHSTNVAHSANVANFGSHLVPSTHQNYLASSSSHGSISHGTGDSTKFALIHHNLQYNAHHPLSYTFAESTSGKEISTLDKTSSTSTAPNIKSDSILAANVISVVLTGIQIAISVTGISFTIYHTTKSRRSRKPYYVR
ncbi:uncharacterized protein CMU_023380 [Cryptosporidium muris RN66]|uniref:Uncharacterized protein n=1 Tax=Cryptosporidium muris (strain RN66) TaxID=441375 RepID=B6ABY0_CRYMR|nr:uncharacterized protein CMU_023380 [Cryptosporidium muris RN66]EEA05333.1 hypothetical protein CMU_023380 [Cryptosporidium muris RN66]|eukprot:XP_002139682.1 hypothetical protein [Cryptosporidium muris RN66]